MAEKYVPYAKCSKAERRRRDAQRRGSWNGVNPVSRVVPNGKSYSRKKLKKTIPGDGWGWPSFLRHAMSLFFLSRSLQAQNAKSFIVKSANSPALYQRCSVWAFSPFRAISV